MAERFDAHSGSLAVTAAAIWRCAKCGAPNYAHHAHCTTCGEEKPIAALTQAARGSMRGEKNP
jgi:uncharacterized OB-fold protein